MTCAHCGSHRYERQDSQVVICCVCHKDRTQPKPASEGEYCSCSQFYNTWNGRCYGCDKYQAPQKQIPNSGIQIPNLGSEQKQDEPIEQELWMKMANDRLTELQRVQYKLAEAEYLYKDLHQYIESKNERIKELEHEVERLHNLLTETHKSATDNIADLVYQNHKYRGALEKIEVLTRGYLSAPKTINEMLEIRNRTLEALEPKDRGEMG